MTPIKRQKPVWLVVFPSNPRWGFEHVVVVPGDEPGARQQVGRLGVEQWLAVGHHIGPNSGVRRPCFMHQRGNSRQKQCIK